MKRLTLSALGGAGVVAGCASMAAMLPGAIAGALGAVGITGASAIARTLSPVAEPLYVGSATLVVLGALACGRLVTLLAVNGSVLLYLSMFQLATGGTTNGSSMSGMATHPNPNGKLHADPLSFYLGLAFLVTAFALSTWRRHRLACRPLLRLPLVTARP
jgi:hypothetical protein